MQCTVEERKKGAGDITKVGVEYRRPFVYTFFHYKNPPFCNGANSLFLNLTLTAFGPGAPVQETVKLKVEHTAEVGVSHSGETIFHSAKLMGDKVAVTLKPKKGLRRLGVGASSKLTWTDGWVLDEVATFFYRPVESEGTPPPTVAPERKLAREEYSPPKGFYGDEKGRRGPGGEALRRGPPRQKRTTLTQLGRLRNGHTERPRITS
ncbi:MAG: hypothetical protein U5N86_03040 [Planctomycetota bacterium]|nr:hypothetical protein [Planctomycetota bacterium]